MWNYLISVALKFLQSCFYQLLLALIIAAFETNAESFKNKEKCLKFYIWVQRLQ